MSCESELRGGGMTRLGAPRTKRSAATSQPIYCASENLWALFWRLALLVAYMLIIDLAVATVCQLSHDLAVGGRHDVPTQPTQPPYHIMVSETSKACMEAVSA